MPLHDWGRTDGWSGVHTSWLVEIARFLRPRLPEGFRAYIGTSPVVAVDDPPGEPDVAVRRLDVGGIGAGPEGSATGADPFQPDRETVLVVAGTEDKSVFVEYGGRLVAAVELISPRNKDRPEERTRTVTRFLGYLTNGVNLLVVDPHPAPRSLSLADLIATRLELSDEPPLHPPYAISYRVGRPFDGGAGRPFAIRRRTLGVGDSIPDMPVALNEHLAVMVDLESTYMRAAADAYLG